MSNQYTRISVPLSQEEFIALSESARQEFRHPRDQARYLLRKILLGNTDETPASGPTPMIGDKSTCTSCGKPVTWMGRYWDHDGDNKPRHIATVEAWK